VCYAHSCVTFEHVCAELLPATLLLLYCCAAPLQFITSREEIDEEYQRRLREMQKRKGGNVSARDTGVRHVVLFSN
jgi:anaerobic C4-dicarboxylate transporter